MKKFAAFVLCIVMLMAVAACAQQAPAPAPVAPTPAAPDPAAPDPAPAPEVNWPTGTVRIVVSVAPGGQVDTIVRSMAPFLQQELNTPVIVENMVGAGGRIAAHHVYDATPDGYTLLATNASDTAMGQITNETRYDIMNFSFIGTFANEGPCLMASLDSGITSVTEMIEAGRAGALTFGVVNLASHNHISSYFLSEVAGIEFNVIPYAGGAPVVSDLLGGHIQLGSGGLSLGVNAHENEQVTMIAQLSDRRSSIAPDIPAITEYFPDYRGTSYIMGMLAPPGLPDEIHDIIVRAYQVAINHPEFLSWAYNAGMDIIDMGPNDFRTAIAEEIALYESLPEVIAEMLAIGG